jgi:hypothetical protein
LSPDEIPLAEFPDYFRPTPKKPLAPAQAEPPRAVVVAAGAGRAGAPLDKLAIASRYLATVTPAIQGAHGHAALLWAARAMVVGCQLAESEAYTILASEYNFRCLPPWDLNDPKDERDFRRKITEAARTPSAKPPGWVLAEHAPPDTSRSDRLADLGASITASLLAAHPELAPNAPPAASEIQSPAPAQSAPLAPATTPAPALGFTLTPPGLVGDICAWLNATAIKRQPLFSLAASLTFCGALFGRKVRDEWNNRTNLYTISIGESSSGKDHARRRIVALCEAAHIENILGGEDVTSDSALEKRFSERPVTLFLWDEVGHLFASIKQAAQNPHLSKIIPFLMKLYSSAGSMYIGKQYSSTDRRTLKQPHCCLYGTTTPERMTGGMTVDEIRDGWIGRILPFYSKENPPKDFTAAKNTKVPEDLAARCAEWDKHNPPAPEGTGDVDAALNPQQHELPTTPEAQKVFLDFEDYAEEKMRDPRIKSKGIDRIWGKAGENARKVALILATGDTTPTEIAQQQIAPSHAEIAVKIMRHINEDFSELIFNSVSESYIEKDKNYLLEVIKQGGKNGITKTKLTNRTQRFNQRQRNEYLADLQESGKIEITIINKNSKPEQKIILTNTDQ